MSETDIDIDMRFASEIAQDIIASISGQNTVLVSEMIDGLLDVMNAAVRTEQAAKRAVTLWTEAARERDFYRESHGEIEIPEGWSPAYR